MNNIFRMVSFVSWTTHKWLFSLSIRKYTDKQITFTKFNIMLNTINLK